MQAKACSSHGFSQFELCKQLYTSGAMSKVKLTPTSKLVLIALTQHYNPNKADMFPSQKFLAAQLGLSERSITNAINELRAKGLIMYETKKVNRYTFTNIFFGLLNFADDDRKNCSQNTEKFANKQINEKKKNTNFSKTSSFNDYKQRKYHHETHIKGIQYQKYTPEKVVLGSPMDYTKEQAIDYIKNLPEILKSSYFAKELVKKYNLTNL